MERDIDEYLGLETLKVVRQPPSYRDSWQFDVIVNVCGGGYTGQAGAIRHGIARALLEADADYRPVLKSANTDVTHVWKSVRNQVSKQFVEHHSSQRDNYLARELQFKEITNLRTSVLGFTLKSDEMSRNVVNLSGLCNKEIYSIFCEEDIHNQDNRRRLWQLYSEKKSTELIKRRISKLPVWKGNWKFWQIISVGTVVMGMLLGWMLY